MLALLRNLLRRPSVPFDPLLTRRLRRTRVKNPQFVSFLSSSGFRRSPWPKHGDVLRRRRAVATALVWALALAFGWGVVESARALSIF
jgi:hypothetical protein